MLTVLQKLFAFPPSYHPLFSDAVYSHNKLLFLYMEWSSLVVSSVHAYKSKSDTYCLSFQSFLCNLGGKKSLYDPLNLPLCLLVKPKTNIKVNYQLEQQLGTFDQDCNDLSIPGWLNVGRHFLSDLVKAEHYGDLVSKQKYFK